MLVSMTGFSIKTVSLSQKNGEALEMTLMLKSLNAKFLEINTRLPFALTHLETEIIKRIKSKLIRGTIYISIQVANPSALKTVLEPAYAIVEGYLKAFNAMQTRFKIPGTITINDFLALPHIFEVPENLIDSDMCALVLHEIDTLADNLMQTRIVEGAAMQQDIQTRITHIRDLLTKLEKCAAEVAEQRKEHLMLTFGPTMTQEPSESRDAQLQFLNTQLIRYDINEEVVRFATHLENLHATIESKGLEKGKKLDFTTQELFREINTLTSKSSNAEVGSLAIGIKLELEKIREQVQNIL